MQGEYDSSGAEDDEGESHLPDDKRVRGAARERLVVVFEKFFFHFRVVCLFIYIVVYSFY